VQGLVAKGYDEALGQWMAINLEPHGGRYRWRIDFDVMEEMLRDFFNADLWPTVARPPEGVEIHFVKANDSNTLEESAAARIEAAGTAAGRVFLHRLDGGHWINTDNPEGVLDLLVKHLP
jgi:hypothetical protein